MVRVAMVVVVWWWRRRRRRCGGAILISESVGLESTKQYTQTVPNISNSSAAGVMTCVCVAIHTRGGGCIACDQVSCNQGGTAKEANLLKNHKTQMVLKQRAMCCTLTPSRSPNQAKLYQRNRRAPNKISVIISKTPSSIKLSHFFIDLQPRLAVEELRKYMPRFAVACFGNRDGPSRAADASADAALR
jgi:hypothetical protein